MKLEVELQRYPLVFLPSFLFSLPLELQLLLAELVKLVSSPPFSNLQYKLVS